MYIGAKGQGITFLVDSERLERLSCYIVNRMVKTQHVTWQIFSTVSFMSILNYY